VILYPTALIRMFTFNILCIECKQNISNAMHVQVNNVVLCNFLGCAIEPR